MNTNATRRYGLFTTIAMIIGIVVGSGIFFKADNVLEATGGSVPLGILVFCLAALSIIFGSLSISTFAQLSDKAGGVITYAEFVGKGFACAFGWFQLFVYLPTLCVVVSWVLGIYISQLFGIGPNIELQFLIGFLWTALCFGYNLLSPKFGGFFQNASMLIKLVPMLLIGVLGFVFGEPGEILDMGGALGGGSGWLLAVGPVAFSFDGWIIATTISHEVRDAKRNVPRALIIAPTIVLIGYLLYFTGINAYIGPEQIRALGDESAAFFAASVFNKSGAKAVLIFIIISVMGTANGITMGLIRTPYSLALRGMLPGSRRMTQTGRMTGLSLRSGIWAIGITIVWWIIHYFVTKHGLLAHSDVSEASVVMTYALYVVLYARVMQYYIRREIRSFAKGVVYPVLAIAGSAFILWGGMQSPHFVYYALMCLAIMIFGRFYYSVSKKRKNMELH